ncbi:MAG: sulfurtransferase complex subunit TusB [Porticoccaceae bacterium]|nr:sulfurtransferase complex subunit TusB [Porticoccaceae bacterium]
MILHTVNKSPYSSQCLSDCLNRVSAGDKVILIEDGVYGATIATDALPSLHSFIQRLLASQVGFYTLRPDAEARGLEAISEQSAFKLLSDHEFVDLVVEANKVLNWY